MWFTSFGCVKINLKKGEHKRQNERQDEIERQLKLQKEKGKKGSRIWKCKCQ